MKTNAAIKSGTIAIAVFTLIFLPSCSRTPEQKACIAIRKYLQENLNDPRSYEPGQFQVDPVYKSIPAYEKSRDSLFVLLKSEKLGAGDYATQDSLLRIKYNSQMMDGWNVIHSYRAKNALGALISNESEFYVDNEFNVHMK
jgi:hypothetical protein